MHSMNGVTSEIKQQPFPTTRKFWTGYLAQQEEQAMKWPNGYSKQMAELYPEDPKGHQKLMNFTALLKSKKREVFDELIQRRWGHQ